MTLEQYTANHRYLVDQVAKALDLADPVAFVASGFYYPLLQNATRGPVHPIDGVITRDWIGVTRKYWPGMQFGIREYHLEGITFARCVAPYGQANSYDFFVVSRENYLKLFKLAIKAHRTKEPEGEPPVLLTEQLETLKQNTLGFLDRKNLQRIKDLGGRPKRGLLLTGPPGNGKTSACRWLWRECLRHGYEYRLVTPDSYRSARGSADPVEAVKELFSVSRRGVIFFDDMDIALRDRNTVGETEDQAVFLSALDGIEVNEGVAYVFTTNCSMSLIDPAFKRPGRIDVVLHLEPPDANLRRQLIQRWHKDVQAGIDVEHAVAQTAGYSFAEVEEVKNLLILLYLNDNKWDWDRAMEQFSENRQELATRKSRSVGFGGAVAANANGNTHN
jgi:hypothetical protein